MQISGWKTHFLSPSALDLTSTWRTLRSLPPTGEAVPGGAERSIASSERQARNSCQDSAAMLWGVATWV